MSSEHWSSCAVHNEPAYPAGECDCGGFDPCSYEAWRHKLAEANDPAFWPITAIDEELSAGRAQFWCDGQTAAVTRTIQYPGGAVVLETLAVTGSMDALWSQIVPVAEQYGRSIGAARIHALGRFGWSRAGEKHGWETEMVLISKGLTQ